jgi:glutamine synthetase
VDAAIKYKPDAPKVPKETTEEKRQALTTFANERLPHYERDHTDRNRTSPFAFTGNKFEFRAVGSSQNVAVPMTAVNSAVAMLLREMNAQVKAKVEGGLKMQDALRTVAMEALTKHKRIIYDGDNYMGDWVIEAEKRGLQNWRNTPAAFAGVDMKEVYCKAGVMSEEGVDARKEVALESYVKCKMIEFQTMCELVQRHVFPSSAKTLVRLGQTLSVAANPRLKAEVDKIAGLQQTLLQKVDELRTHMEHQCDDLQKEATHIAEKTEVTMTELRVAADALEDLCAAEDWTLPSYHDLLFKQC